MGFNWLFTTDESLVWDITFSIQQHWTLKKEKDNDISSTFRSRRTHRNIINRLLQCSCSRPIRWWFWARHNLLSFALFLPQLPMECEQRRPPVYRPVCYQLGMSRMEVFATAVKMNKPRIRPLYCSSKSSDHSTGILSETDSSTSTFTNTEVKRHFNQNLKWDIELYTDTCGFSLFMCVCLCVLLYFR